MQPPTSREEAGTGGASHATYDPADRRISQHVILMLLICIRYTNFNDSMLVHDIVRLRCVSVCFCELSVCFVCVFCVFVCVSRVFSVCFLCVSVCFLCVCCAFLCVSVNFLCVSCAFSV